MNKNYKRIISSVPIVHAGRNKNLLYIHSDVNKGYFYRFFVDCEVKWKRRLFTSFDSYHCFWSHTQTNKQKQTLREKGKENEREIDEAERVKCKYV